MAWQNFPMITCPHCGKVSQIDDYYHFKSGDSFSCPKCDKEIYVWDTDTVFYCDLFTHEQ